MKSFSASNVGCKASFVLYRITNAFYCVSNTKRLGLPPGGVLCHIKEKNVFFLIRLYVIFKFFNNPSQRKFSLSKDLAEGKVIRQMQKQSKQIVWWNFETPHLRQELDSLKRAHQCVLAMPESPFFVFLLSSYECNYKKTKKYETEKMTCF